jgi:aminoglycoside phosphotransferase (APT) family kinase protein
LTRAGRIVALIDWSNAVVGPRALEFARVAEYGEELLGPDEVAALEAGGSWATALRLDTAVMLAVVFLSEAPDPERAAPAIERVRSLTRQLLVQR